MGFLETADLAAATSFRMRLMACIVKVAGTVQDEDQSNMAGPHGSKRLDLASSVMLDPAAKAPAFIWPVLSNQTIAAAGLDAADGDLEYQVNQVWDHVAGVTRFDKIVAPAAAATAGTAVAVDPATTTTTTTGTTGTTTP